MLALLGAPGAFAAGKLQLKAASYDLTSSVRRKGAFKGGKCDAQKLWCNCRQAIVEEIAALDCDVIGIQDLCDSIAGRFESGPSLLESLNERGLGYEWMTPSNSNPNFPLDGHLVNGVGVMWKAARFECEDWGINWLGGLFDKPGRDKALKYGQKKHAVAWVRLKDKKSGESFYFASAIFNDAKQYTKQGKLDYPEINVANARNLVKILSDKFPEKVPSIIALSAYAQPNSEGYSILKESRWINAYEDVNTYGTLDPEDKTTVDTCSSYDEKGPVGGRRCHIYFSEVSAKTYTVERSKRKTADGSLHYPSLTFPVVVEFE